MQIPRLFFASNLKRPYNVWLVLILATQISVLVASSKLARMTCLRTHGLSHCYIYSKERDQNFQFFRTVLCFVCKYARGDRNGMYRLNPYEKPRLPPYACARYRARLPAPWPAPPACSRSRAAKASCMVTRARAIRSCSLFAA